jgi:DNA repair protein RadC
MTTVTNKIMTATEKVSICSSLEHLDILELFQVFLDVNNNPELELVAQSLAERINLKYLERVTVADLVDYGVPYDKALSLRAMLELSYRSFVAKSSFKSVFSSYRLCEDLQARYGKMSQEHLVVICLDTKLQVIEEKVVHIGSTSKSLAVPKDLLYPAIKNQAECIVLCHNHPSGEVYPSRNDDEMTERLRDVCKLLEITLLDHIIVSNYESYSYRANQRILDELGER